MTVRENDRRPAAGRSADDEQLSVIAPAEEKTGSSDVVVGRHDEKLSPAPRGGELGHRACLPARAERVPREAHNLEIRRLAGADGVRLVALSSSSHRDHERVGKPLVEKLLSAVQPLAVLPRAEDDDSISRLRTVSARPEVDLEAGHRDDRKSDDGKCGGRPQADSGRSRPLASDVSFAVAPALRPNGSQLFIDARGHNPIISPLRTPG